MGDSVEVTKANFTELSALCNKFGFELKTPPPSYRLCQLEVTVEELKSRGCFLSEKSGQIGKKSWSPIEPSAKWFDSGELRGIP
jgi:hypothetical protein